MTLVSQERDDEALLLYTEAIAVYREVLDRNLPHYAQRRIGYGVLLTRRGRYEDAEGHLLAGLETFRLHLGPDDSRTRAVVSDLVTLYEAWGDSGKAAEYRALLGSDGGS
jgi:tetratricopeptide (TPR) repeat protein